MKLDPKERLCHRNCALPFGIRRRVVSILKRFHQDNVTAYALRRVGSLV